VWSLSEGSSSSKSPSVSQQHFDLLVGLVQSSVNLALLLEGDVSPDHVVSQPIQLGVEKVV